MQSGSPVEIPVANVHGGQGWILVDHERQNARTPMILATAAFHCLARPVKPIRPCHEAGRGKLYKTELQRTKTLINRGKLQRTIKQNRNRGMFVCQYTFESDSKHECVHFDRY